MSGTTPGGVLFVCLGNICRSPLARAVLQHKASRRGVDHLLEVDSCGTGGWHAGDGADPRSVAVAARYGVELRHVARRFDPRSDPRRFGFIIAMDRSNIANLERAGLPPGRASLLRAFDPALAGAGPAGLEVPDPYYGGDDGFERVYAMIDTACDGLLDHVLRATRA
ncbi:MAG: low molecular weight phosphotyrosine protein phosphatase [Phycisphaeraceae bacterium]|nr:MAG: low molecular weight phosphotyrosine protein phosphatase [Phycisphaeraceae bacterium]